MSFNNKKVIVTGASRGIGRAIALAFAKSGADVLISYAHNQSGAAETLSLIEQIGANGFSHQADFSNLDTIPTFFEKAVTALGRVDILINNAATLSRDNFFEVTPAQMQYLFQINTIAPFYLTQTCVNHMISNNHPGCIINISSISGIMTANSGIGYAASKAALNKWTKNATQALAKHHIRINAIAPGVIQGGMNENTATEQPALWETFLKSIPLNRTGQPDDIANMVLFLASEKADWITGKIIEVDGGHVL